MNDALMSGSFHPALHLSTGEEKKDSEVHAEAVFK